MRAKTFHIATFGCRTNQADSATLRDDFLSRGYSEQLHPGADVVVVNSCTVTHRSDQQVRQMVRRLRRENPDATVVVTGCYAQRDPGSLARIEGVDAVVGNSHKAQVADIAETLPAQPPGLEELARVYRDPFDSSRRMEASPAFRTGGRTRPFVKIQDGCDALGLGLGVF